MVHGLALTAVLLLMLAFCGQIVDDLLSEQQHRSIKDRLADWYVAVADEKQWQLLVAGAARVTESVMGRWFGAGFWSWNYLVLVFVINVVVLSIVSRHYYFGLSGDTSHYEYDRSTFSWAMSLANALIDVAALGVGRIILRRIARSSHKSSATWTATLLTAVAYASIVLGSLALIGILFLMFFYFGHVTVNTQTPQSPLYWITVDALLWPQAALASPAALIILLPGLSAIVFLSILLLSIALILLRPLIQVPLGLILERLADSPKGVIATVSKWIALIGGIVVALKDYVSK